MAGVLCVALCACATGAAVELEGSGPRDAEADAPIARDGGGPKDAGIPALDAGVDAADAWVYVSPVDRKCTSKADCPAEWDCWTGPVVTAGPDVGYCYLRCCANWEPASVCSEAERKCKDAGAALNCVAPPGYVAMCFRTH